MSLLLGYPEGSAGRVMNPNYLALPADTPAHEALQRLRESPLDPEYLEMVLVLGEGRQYLGYVTVAQLLKAPPDAPLKMLISDAPVAVSAYDSQDKVAEMFARRQYPLIAVVDREGRLIGAIDAERGLELVEESEAQRLTVFGGTVAVSGPDVDIVQSPLLRIFKARVFWLIVLTFFGVITSTFVAQQEELLSRAIVLAAFIAPIIDMGGNTGSQSATLVIRAMALGQVRLRDFLFILKRDVPVALAMGVTIGVLEAILAYFSKGIGGSVLLVVGLAMLTVTIVGSLIGVGLPFVARRLGFDPATLSGPVITSVMDLSGVMIYFGYAYWFLSDLIKQ
jgi:magnesium transporter